MKNAYSVLRECVFTCPLALLAITDKKLLAIANSYLPYSTGFEIECGNKNMGRDFKFTTSNLIDDCYNDDSEKRFRIPPGIEGLIALWYVCEELKQKAELNKDSGIHYHIDCTDLPFKWYNGNRNTEWDITTPAELFHNNGSNDSNTSIQSKALAEPFLRELQKWNYRGTYNARRILLKNNGWIRFSHHNTMEFRCGEMSFDYEHLAFRAIHANSITRRVKKILTDEFTKRTKLVA